MDAEVSKLN